jgi:CheY-like chemotaxis protein
MDASADASTNAKPAAEADGGAAAPPLALIVDDNAVNRSVTGHMLRRIGWGSVQVESGERALQELRSRPFDLLLLDLRMQDMDGEETCRRVRDELGLRALKVVAYTAHGMEDDRERILAAGFDRMLIKPIFLDDLRALCGGIRGAAARGTDIRPPAHGGDVAAPGARDGKEAPP